MLRGSPAFRAAVAHLLRAAYDATARDPIELGRQWIESGIGELRQEALPELPFVKLDEGMPLRGSGACSAMSVSLAMREPNGRGLPVVPSALS